MVVAVFLSLPTLPCPISFMTPRFNYAFIYPERFFVALGFPYFCCFCSSGIKKTYASRQSVLKIVETVGTVCGKSCLLVPFSPFWHVLVVQNISEISKPVDKKHNRSGASICIAKATYLPIMWVCYIALSNFLIYQWQYESYLAAAQSDAESLPTQKGEHLCNYICWLLGIFVGTTGSCVHKAIIYVCRLG